MAKTVKGKAEVVKMGPSTAKAFSEWQVWTREYGPWEPYTTHSTEKGAVARANTQDGYTAIIHITIPAIK